MDPSLRAAASGMIAQQTRIEVISNNLANVNTTGFKRSRAHFEDLLYQTRQGQSAVELPGGGTLPAVQVGRGTRLAAVQKITGQGAIQQTGRPFDLAIEGDGYFQVRLPDGNMGFTRDGSFQISDQGTLVTHGGYTVQPGIQIPSDASEVTISRSGVVTAQMGPADAEPVEVGRIEMARFANPPGLRAMGENILVETPSSGRAITGFAQQEGFGRLVSGSLESSNVKIVQEMVDMIGAMRAFEIGSRAVQSSEEMAEITARMGR
jgi:flagellar basal-body rod protein FlgG